LKTNFNTFMTESPRIVFAATVLRLLLGWYMLIDGAQILLTPGWSASGFLLGAKTFPAFYAWFALPMNGWWVNPLNSWGITLIGAALILGVGVRVASWAGALMMILYYFPHYAFPIVPYGYIVEEHIIYAAAFVLFAVWPAAEWFGLGRYLRGTALGRIPILGALL
jgi:thiosulfate dehydrogenase (quinone) large subunit